MIETIIFDLSEVYLVGRKGMDPEVANFLNKDVTEVNEHFLGENMDLLCTGKITEDEYWQRVIDENNYPRDAADYDSTIDFLKAAVRRNFKEIPGTRRIIEALKQQGYKLGLLSDHAKEWVEYIEARFPVADLFPIRVYGCEIGYTKKSPPAFQYILNKLDAKPETTLFIDDQQKNLLVALNKVRIGYAHRFVNASALEGVLSCLNVRLSI